MSTVLRIELNLNDGELMQSNRDTVLLFIYLSCT